MNEQIKTLFKRAGGKSSVRNLMSNPVQHVETHELWDDRIDKFAELLIRECVNVCYENQIKEGRLSPRACGDDILKHFGMNE